MTFNLLEAFILTSNARQSITKMLLKYPEKVSAAIVVCSEAVNKLKKTEFAFIVQAYPIQYFKVYKAISYNIFRKVIIKYNKAV